MLQLLRDLNIDDNTLVFFCSDNGAANRYDNVFDSSGPLRGRKRDLYEGGIRTPMLVWGPGNVPPGTVSTVAWSFADVLPTLADAAGATPPPDIDGVSVLPTLLGQEQPELVDRPIYFELHEGLFQQAIRRGKWKAVRRDPPSSTELYDLSVDIGESNNIASQHPDIVEEMEALFISMRSPSVGWPTVLDYDEISDDEPVSGWLPLSETEGLTAADHSGRDVSGELHNVEGNPWGHDESGPYLTLNAAQQQVLRIEGTTGASQAHPRTVAAWIRTDTPAAIFSWGDRSSGGRLWQMRIDPGTSCLRVEVQNGYVIGSRAITDNTWRHVAAVFDPDNRGTNVTGVRLFIDGEEETISASLSQTIQTALGSTIWVGGEPGNNDRYFSGRLRHVQWWNEALTPEAIQALAETNLSHAGRWLTSHFPSDTIGLDDPAPASSHPLLLYYAAGRKPGDDPLPTLLSAHLGPDRELFIHFDLHPQARLQARPFYTDDLRSPDWQDGTGVFQEHPAEGARLTWRPPGDTDSLFVRMQIDALP